MKPQLIIGLVIILFSCSKRETNQDEQLDSLEFLKGNVDFKEDEFENRSDCDVWLADYDTILSSGVFIKYVKKDDIIKLEWGNREFRRTLRNDYHCDGAPAWVPTIRWSTSKYIGLKYGCGSPCWGLIILPLNISDSAIERMYDLHIDTIGNRIVYPDNKTYETLIIENFVTGQKISIESKFKCKAAFMGHCIDSMDFSKDSLMINWVDWIDDEKVIREEKFKMRI